MRKYLLFSLSLILFSSCISQKKLLKQNKISKVIGEARTYIGTPYKWGGNDKKGIDCSGLLVKSFESVGMKNQEQPLSRLTLVKGFLLENQEKVI